MHPELKRKYGKCNFERFDHFSPSHASLGGGQIGKVKVDCRFRFQKSQWGVLGSTQNPAGIIYLDLYFDQPVDCRLKSATVTVTLDDDEHTSRSNRDATTHNNASKIPAQFTPWFGPQQLSGQPRYKLMTKRNQMTPYVEAMGMVGAGGVGRDSDETFVKESCWKFTGRVLPGKETWAYKTIKWELTENDLESQPIHNNVIHTAFSFQHEGQPFLLKVEVSGKLRSINNRVKHRLKKFASSLTKDGGCATTLINFGGRDTFQQPLDELARGLKDAMEMENLAESPILIPNPQRASFKEDTMMAESSPTNEGHPVGPPGLEKGPPDQFQRAAHALITGPPQSLAQLMGEQDIDGDTSGTMAPTIANLAEAVAGFTAPKPLPHTHEAPPSSRDHVDSPMYNASRDTTNADSLDIHKIKHHSTKSEDKKLSRPQADQEAMLALLQFPGVLSVIQLIVAFLASCGVKLSSKEGMAKDKSEVDSEHTRRNVVN